MLNIKRYIDELKHIEDFKLYKHIIHNLSLQIRDLSVVKEHLQKPYYKKHIYFYSYVPHYEKYKTIYKKNIGL